MIIDFNYENIQNFPTNYAIGKISYIETQNKLYLPHCHNNSEIFIPLNNYGSLLLGSEILKMEKPNIYIVPPNIMHTELNTNESHSLKYCCINFPYSIFHTDNSKSKVYIINAEDIIDELIFYIRACVKFQQLKSDANSTLKMLNVYCIFELINSLINNNGYIKKTNNIKIVDPIVEEVVFYIETNFSSQILIEELAQKYSISHRALSKKFQKSIGMSPKGFLMKTIIEYAKENLLSTDYSISQICSLCGFDNFAFFTSYFKKYTGITPTEFRRKNKK